MEIGLVGFGSFGKFIFKQISPYFQVKVHDQHISQTSLTKFEITNYSLEEVTQCDVIILSVPVQFLKKVIKNVAKHINKNALVIDVSSVKERPIKMMEKYLPDTVGILGTHPLFGPQSGANGISGLNMVISPVRIDRVRLRYIVQFLEDELELVLLKRTAEVHDKQMAYVQALTHFIGRAINEIDIPDIEQKTPAYQFLLNIKKNLGKDSLDLFLTIERENPYATDVLDDFMKELQRLREMI
ncbi:prephenate dehydrogenase/arogenate dehydrogenase family protein [Cyclobacteriaceae bacterium]|nr:prephenate dehydrogenase/arogenate dehydrogenase family protein [Cyclobacteriaceae bacterium]